MGRAANAVSSRHTCSALWEAIGILDEEAERLLGKPASEGELRKAEKRIMHRLGGGSAASSRMSARKGDGIITGRSALSHASSVLDEVATARSSARVNGPLDAEHLL